MVSARTVAAARVRGVRLGNPRPDLAKARAAASAEATAFRGGVAPEVARLRGEGRSLGQIANLLNRRGVKAARGGRWHKASVAGVLREDGAPRT